MKNSSHHPQVKSKPAKSRWLYFLGGTVVTIALLSWALKDVDPRVVWQTFQQARWEWLLLGWIAYLGVFWIRARRWGTLLSATCAPGSFRARLFASFIGFGAVSVLPAYAGELVRAGMLKRLANVPLKAAIGSIFAERLLDVGVVFLLLLLPVWLGLLPNNHVLEQLPIGWIGFVLILGWLACLVAATYPGQISRGLGTVSQAVSLGRLRTRIESSTIEFLGGLNALRQPKRTLTLLGETCCSWGLNAITYWSGLMAFDIVEPGFPGALFIQSVSALAIALPSTPGYVGPFEAAIRFSLNIYQVPVRSGDRLCDRPPIFDVCHHSHHCWHHCHQPWHAEGKSHSQRALPPIKRFEPEDV